MTDLFHPREFEAELKQILSFWEKYAIDPNYGGYIGELSNRLQVNETAGKGGVLNARILWTWSAVAHHTLMAEYKQLADAAYAYFVGNFFDAEYGGTYWMLDYKGNPAETRKQTYAQAFSIYALTEYAKIYQDDEPVELAWHIYDLIEKHAFDRQHNGYLEAFSREWKLHEDQRLSAIDMNERKSMNTHLHVIEAYANLYAVTKNQLVKEKVENLLYLFEKHIVNPDTGHFNLFFDEKWHVKSRKVSYGHDVEGSWLLLESALIIDSEPWITHMKKISAKMAGASLEGIDADGGLKYEFAPGEQDGGEKEWWTMAEAVVGFYNAYQLSGSETYLKAAAGMWDYLKAYFIDREFGEWVYRIDRDHKPVDTYPKISQWKCPYHNARMCMEMIRRLKNPAL